MSGVQGRWSIGFEESVVGSAAADLKFDALEAFGTAAFVSRALPIDVNTEVNATTVELNADEFASNKAWRRFAGRCWLLRKRIARKIKGKHRREKNRVY